MTAFSSYSTGTVSIAGALPSAAGSPPASNTAVIAAPVQNAASTATTGGTLAAATYYYKVTALTASGETVGSNEQSILTTGTTSSNTVSWAAVPGATGYRVYRGTAAAGENAYYAPGNVTTFSDTGAASTAGSPPASNTAALPAPTQNAPTTSTTGGNLAAATYYYKVTALNAAGETIGSAEQSVATTGATSTNTVTWAAVTGATGYRVYRGTAAAGENIYFSPGNVTTFSDIGTAATTVTGTSTIWSGVNARPGDLLQVGGFQTVISDVPDTTHLTIPAWGGGAQSAVPYNIFQTSPLRYAGGQAMADVSALVAVLNGMGTIYAVTGAAPDPSIGSDGQYALKTNTTRWQAWLKTGGTWVLQGAPVGVSYRNDINNGNWLATGTYAVGDMTSAGGTLYISNVANNLNFPPATNPTQWTQAAAAGAQGNTGPQGAAGTNATIVVNSTNTLPAGSAATVSNLGTSSAASLQFGIPQGPQGIQGGQGPQGVGLNPDDTGTLTQRATHDGAAAGYKFLQTDVSPFRFFVKASTTTGDWAGPTYIGGNFPVGDMGHITDSVIQTFDFGHIV